MASALAAAKRAPTRRRMRQYSALIAVALIGSLAAVVIARGAVATPQFPADNFNNRVVAPGWGADAAGARYSYVGAKGNLGVANGVGAIKVQPGTSQGAFIGASTGQVRVTAAFAGPARGQGWGYAVYVTARKIGSVGEYRARLRVSSIGGLSIVLARGNARGLDVPITGAVALPLLHIGPRKFVHLTMQLTGSKPTTLRAHAWQDGKPEPTSWKVTKIDGTAGIQNGGAVGVRAFEAQGSLNALTLHVNSWSTAPTTAPTTTTQPPTTSPVTTPPPSTSTTPPPSTSTTGHTTSDFSPAPLATGAVAMGSAAYAIPAGAYFVSPSGNDNNSGTLAAPFKTVVKAAAVAPSGSTIVLRGGTYHEFVDVHAKQLTFQNYPGEAAIFKGSVIVSGWVHDGSTWRHDGWTAEFPNGGWSQFIDPTYPMSTYADQAFMNGNELTQVASKAAVVAGTFYVDDAANALYVGNDPNGQTVEASDLKVGLSLTGADGSVVRGLGFEHYATTPDQLAAVQGFSDNLRFENDVFSQNAFAGLSVIGKNATVLDNTMSHNGQLGLHGDHVTDSLVRGNVMDHDNAEHIKLDSAEGGMKFTTSTNVLVDHNLFADNYGRGVWFDVGSDNLQLVHNTSRDNLDRGLQVEISGDAIVASNYVYDNGGFGIYVVESHDVKVYNNTTARNYHDIYVLEGSRPQNVSNVTVVNNIMSEVGNGGTFVFGVDDATHSKSAEAMGVSADGNAYYRPSASAPSWLVDWSEWPTQSKVFTALSDYSAFSGMEANGVSIDSASDPFFVSLAGDNFKLSPSSPALNHGLPLPSDVANIIGAPTGVPVNIGALG